MGKQPQVQVWVMVSCPRCSRDVAFLPAQHENKCGWCLTVVRR